ncbi:hypothetical protein AB9P05_22070 [Roseivirga sp. BDSF3-8]|uniref:hypothetical protein n=1 Tax=Roseivirga sp. BDSF3-8 TaxID=3241598 RepID=UPI00353200B5
MRKFLIRSAVYLVILLLIANGLAALASYSLRHSAFYKSTFLVHSFDEGTRFDYFLLGSSRGLTTLDTHLADSLMETNGINLSMDDTDLKSQLLMMRHFFSSGYKADVCVLVLDKAHFEKTSGKLGNNDYRFAPFAARDYVYQHFMKYEEGTVKPLAYSAWLPFLSFSYYNLELAIPSLLTALKPERRNRFDERGNYTYPVRKYKEQKADKEEIAEGHITNPRLGEFVALAKENNCRLLFYVAPYQNIHYTEILSHFPASVINHTGVIKDDSLFFDHLHVNTIGRREATRSFAEAYEKAMANGQ